MNPTGLGAFDTGVVHDMQRWLERAVIGLNLCPFAKSVYVRGQVHWALSRASSSLALEDDLVRELAELVASPPAERDTTLLVVPRGMSDFFEFNLFLTDAGRILKRMGLIGTIQIASFHPDFQFANTTSDALGNFTNRSPYPTLHLLRESSIARAVEAFPDAQTIYGNNIATLERLGHAGWHKLGVDRTTPDPRDDAS
jgi:hypothetical protein